MVLCLLFSALMSRGLLFGLGFRGLSSLVLRPCVASPLFALRLTCLRLGALLSALDPSRLFLTPLLFGCPGLIFLALRSRLLRLALLSLFLQGGILLLLLPLFTCTLLLALFPLGFPQPFLLAPFVLFRADTIILALHPFFPLALPRLFLEPLFAPLVLQSLFAPPFTLQLVEPVCLKPRLPLPAPQFLQLCGPAIVVTFEPTDCIALRLDAALIPLRLATPPPVVSVPIPVTFSAPAVVAVGARIDLTISPIDRLLTIPVVSPIALIIVVMIIVIAQELADKESTSEG